MELGYSVCTPAEAHLPYDMVIEVDGHFWRVQCKTARIIKWRKPGGSSSSSKTSIRVHTIPRGHSRDHADGHNYYLSRADLMAVVSPDTSTVYLMPVSEVGRGCLCLAKIKRWELDVPSRTLALRSALHRHSAGS